MLRRPPRPQPFPTRRSSDLQYMRERRAALGGYLPRRVVRAKPLTLPAGSAYDELKRGSGKQPVATTMAFVRLRSEEHTSELQSRQYLVCRLLLEKKMYCQVL